MKAQLKGKGKSLALAVPRRTADQSKEGGREGLTDPDQLPIGRRAVEAKITQIFVLIII